MITGNMGAENLSGPVGIAKMSGEAFSAGFYLSIFNGYFKYQFRRIELAANSCFRWRATYHACYRGNRGEPLPQELKILHIL